MESSRDKQSHNFRLILDCVLLKWNGRVGECPAHLINMHNNNNNNNNMYVFYCITLWTNRKLTCWGNWKLQGWGLRYASVFVRFWEVAPNRLAYVLFTGSDNPLKHSGNHVYHQLWYSKDYAFLYCACMCFVWLLKQTGIISQYSDTSANEWHC
jgi:hypothetical protein